MKKRLEEASRMGKPQGRRKRNSGVAAEQVGDHRQHAIRADRADDPANQECRAIGWQTGADDGQNHVDYPAKKQDGGHQSHWASLIDQMADERTQGQQ